MAIRNLTYEDIIFKVDTDSLRTGKSSDLWFGQERIKNAVSFITNYDSRNLYLSGNFTPSDRKYLMQSLKDLSKPNKVNDWCYIYNFKEPINPIAVKLSSGQAPLFKSNMKMLLDNFKREIPEVLESKEFSLRIRQITNEIDDRIGKRFEMLKTIAAGLGFIIKPSSKGLQINPTINKKIITEQDFPILSDDQKQLINQNRRKLDDKIAEYLENIRVLEKEKWKKLKKVRNEVILLAISQYIDELIKQYIDCDKIKEYLKSLEEYTVDHAEQFLPEKPQQFKLEFDGKTMLPFEVNVLIDSSNQKTPPVIYEDNPTFYNICGRVEKKAMFGNLITDFTMIKAGSLHKANDGYLILDAERVLSRPGSWWLLKNALLSKEIKIENIEDTLGYLSIAGIRAEPIKLNTHVILLGSRYIYSLLSAYDHEFKLIFNLKADFNYALSLSVENSATILTVIKEKFSNANFTDNALKEIIKFASRSAGSRKKITAKVYELVTLCKEAVSIAKDNKLNQITEAHIKDAIKSDIYRKELMREKIVEAIKDKQIMIETEGRKIGQVNGLAVIRDGDFQFGIANRISASCFMGKAGIINIERESDMSGPTFNKASMIIAGYLGQKYAQKHPLSLSASLAFEQSYGLIEGDSASVAELVTLLSRLSDIPIRQDIAVTGSLSQAGEVQPIGGINEKIEGFYRICKEKGLTGNQGVLFPSQNKVNLILSDEVEQAVKDGNFHLHTMTIIDDAIELFTGMLAGKLLDSGYEKNSIHYLIDKKLTKYAKYSMAFKGNA